MWAETKDSEDNIKPYFILSTLNIIILTLIYSCEYRRLPQVICTPYIKLIK